MTGWRIVVQWFRKYWWVPFAVLVLILVYPFIRVIGKKGYQSIIDKIREAMIRQEREIIAEEMARQTYVAAQVTKVEEKYREDLEKLDEGEKVSIGKYKQDPAGLEKWFIEHRKGRR